MPKKIKTAIIVLAALAGLALLAAAGYCIAVTLLVSAPQLGVSYSAAGDFPAGGGTMYVTGAGKRGKTYYVVAEADGEEYTFRLAEGFTARAFEPGADGALSETDYNSPEEFYTRWYRVAKDRGVPGAAFSFAFAGDELVSLADTSEPSPPDGP